MTQMPEVCTLPQAFRPIFSVFDPSLPELSIIKRIYSWFVTFIANVKILIDSTTVDTIVNNDTSNNKPNLTQQISNEISNNAV